MTKVDSEILSKFQEKLATYPEIQETIQILDECDGDLEDAASLIAVRAGEPVTMGDSILEDLVRRAKKHLCDSKYQDSWDDIKDVADILMLALGTEIPPTLLILCAMKLFELGLKDLCKTDS